MLHPSELQAELQTKLQTLGALEGHAAKQFAAELIERLLATTQTLGAQLKFEQTRANHLALEVARLKQWRFGKSSEALHSTQGELFEAATERLLVEESAAEDCAAAATEAADRQPNAKKPAPKRQALPAHLPRIEHHHEITPAVCTQGHPLKRIGQELSERLDCVPAQFFVHRHIRGKYACACCQTIVAASMPAQVIDKGIPAAGLLAQVIIAKFDDHLPLYRQEDIYRRSGAHIRRSTMAQWVGECGVRLAPLAQALRQLLMHQAVLHGDETPIRLLEPGSGKTRTAYMWVWRSSDLDDGASADTKTNTSANASTNASTRAVVYQFATSREGRHAHRMLEGFGGTLLTDHYAGYKALYAQGRIQEAGCWAHARRKFFEAHKLNQSAIAQEALTRIGQLYAVEQEARDMPSQARRQWRQDHAAPHLQAFKAWLLEKRPLLAPADATAKAMDYTLGRWSALLAYLEDGRIPIDNNAVENAIRPLALGRKNWLFIGSEQAGERAAVLMTLIESARMNGHDPWAYLKDVLDKLPTWPNSRLAELLPHKWVAPVGDTAQMPSASMPTSA